MDRVTQRVAPHVEEQTRVAEPFRWLRWLSVGLMHLLGWGICAVWVAVTIRVDEREPAEASAEAASIAKTRSGRSYAAPMVNPQTNRETFGRSASVGDGWLGV